MVAQAFSLLFVGTVAERLGVAPHVITYLFRRQRLDGKRCPVVSGRRLIPEDYLGEIAREVRRMKHRKWRR